MTSLKRISLMIREDQYERLLKEGVNLSGLFRALLDDHFSAHKITLAVGAETRSLYDKIVSNTGTADTDVEPFVREALRALLKEKIRDLQELERTVFENAVKKGAA